jgi:hypothetical protein
VLDSGKTPGQFLERLQLNKCYIPEGGGMLIATALKAGNKKLRVLGMANNFLGNNSAGLFGEVMESNHTLLELDLSWNQIKVGYWGRKGDQGEKEGRRRQGREGDGRRRRGRKGEGRQGREGGGRGGKAEAGEEGPGEKRRGPGARGGLSGGNGRKEAGVWGRGGKEEA